MNDLQIDEKKMLKLILEISSRISQVKDLFCDGNSHLLRHLAASAIHLTMFTKDLAEISSGEKFFDAKELENEFLRECGCDFNKDNAS